MCRRAYGEIRLHRPLGDQLPLFLQHLPGQRTRVAGYDDTLTPEQVAAMMPTAAHVAGSRAGFYLGHTLTGSRQPVRFNLREGSDSDRNTTILSVGALGSGKTTLDQKLKYEGFLQGARVIDCDPKGDHRFHLLEEVAPHTECVTLQARPGAAGRARPAAGGARASAPGRRRVVPARSAAGQGRAGVGDGGRGRGRPRAAALARADLPGGGARAGEGDETDAQVGKTLEVYARSGLTQLGFADPAVKLPPVGHSQVTYLPIRDLPGPEPGTRRSEYSQAERVGEQIVRLIAMFAMHLMGAERERLKLFSFDEGWRLLGDPVGRQLLASLQRMGRSELAVPIISHAARDRCAGRRARVAGEPDRGDVRVRDALGGGGGAGACSCWGSTPRTGGCARACSSSTRGAACSATTPAGWRRSRSTWWCRRCCARSRRLPGSPDGGGQARRSGVCGRVRVRGGAHVGVWRTGGERCQASPRRGAWSDPGKSRSNSATRPETPTPTRAPAAAKNAPATGPPRAPSAPLSSGGAGLSPEEEASASALAEWRRPAGGQRAGQPAVRERASAELSPAEREQLPHLGLRGGAGADGQLRVRRAHRHRRARTGGNDLTRTVQNLVQWGWTLLVAVVHGVIVMLEWCYTIDLLDSSAMGGVTQGLRETQATFTQPWLVLVLAVAAVLALYHGLVRRQVSETVGQALLMLAMMVAGLWVIVNPLGHRRRARRVGQRGQPGHARRGGCGHARTIPTARWRTAWEASSAAAIGGRGATWSSATCAGARTRASSTASAAQDGALEDRARMSGRTSAAAQSAELLRGARTNGELFLALPANGPERNSINDPARCSTCCAAARRTMPGPTAGEAEFRTEGGTGWRVVGLCLDLDRRAGHDAAARLHRAAPARRGDREPVLPAAGAGGGARAGAGRRRARGVSRAGRRGCSGRCVEADLLVSARRRAADAANVARAHRARLVRAVAARLGDVVGSVPPAPSGAGLRPGQHRAELARTRRRDAAGVER